MNEVKHLNKLRHSHIVQLVGSYIQGRTFAVLLYPVADLDLKDFMQEIENVLVPHRTIDYGSFMAIASLGRFFKCLASALGYVHSQTTKHLDIKPRNILIKRSRDVIFGYQVYLADFGISRSFSPTDHSQTDAWVGRTAKYCAPEVHWNESHGRSADVFSMGCVFLEMQTVLCGHPLDDL
ncbi:kinase-like protein, partial [Periconia macrospinosa]